MTDYRTVMTLLIRQRHHQIEHQLGSSLEIVCIGHEHSVE